MAFRRATIQNARCSTLAACAAAVVLALASCGRAPGDPVEQAARRISASRVQDHGRTLAADAMAGRYYASPEADSVAVYLLAELDRQGIRKVARAEELLGSQAGCFVHAFSVTLSRIGHRTSLAVVRGAASESARLGRDFVPLLFSRSVAVEGPVVRLVLPPGGTQGPARDVAGKVVVMDPAVAGENHGPQGDAALFHLACGLEERGAAAILFAADASLLHTAAATYPDHLTPEQEAAIGSARGAAVNLRAERLCLASQAQAWHEASRRTPPALVVRDGWAARLEPGDWVQLCVDLRSEVSLAQNVLVGFRGRARPEELVVVGANYDHAGINAAGEVLNGADDNGSGVAALLEVATALVPIQAALQRSVLLAFFSAARVGLQGSEVLLQDLSRLLGADAHPVAMLSLRAVGRNADRPMLLVGGDRCPRLAATIDRYDRREFLAGARLGLQRVPDETTPLARLEVVPSRGSEHLAFARDGVPSLLLADGLDPALHGQPEDDWRLVDATKVARVARLVFRATYELATDLQLPVATAGVPPP